MLCKKHVVEECNSSDCEACGMETKIKRLETDCEVYSFQRDSKNRIIKEQDKKNGALKELLETHEPHGHNVTNEQHLKLREENYVLKEFVLSMASQLEIIVKKL